MKRLLLVLVLISCGSQLQAHVVVCARQNEAEVAALVDKLLSSEGDWSTLGRLAASAGVDVGACALKRILGSRGAALAATKRGGSPADAVFTFNRSVNTLVEVQ